MEAEGDAQRLKTQKPNEKGTLLMEVDRDREGGRDGGRATAWRASGRRY